MEQSLPFQVLIGSIIITTVLSQALFVNKDAIRTARQNGLQYLPPSNTEKPRPFEPLNPSPSPSDTNNRFTGYPLPGSSPQPPFTDYTRPTAIYTTPEKPYSPTTEYPGPSTGYPGPSTGYPRPSTGYLGPSTAYPGSSTGYPAPPSSTGGYPSPPTTSGGYPTTGYPGPPSYPTTRYPPQSVPTNLPPRPTDIYTTERPDNEGYETQGNGNIQTTPGQPDDDDRHPPHIHAVDVECAKDMMTINIEFNRVYNGIIYSKGFYNQQECRYVYENSGQVKYSFTVSLNSCGTQFINAFETQGQSYLENVLVLQNEANIQEVWDTIRSVRCLWEGNLNKKVNVALSVGMLNQEIITFSGDTAMARLDIQLGRGPFAPAANGLVKIGETMTLVVTVTGDAGFDIQVKDCYARDSNSLNTVALTDENGCVLKPKLFGAFQKTRNTGNTGASIIAYAFFSAFKFPDIMDLILECNIELCKTDCEVCPILYQQTEPGRRRRRESGNETIAEPVLVGKLIRVILPEDISDENGTGIIQLDSHFNEGICMSHEGFFVSSALLVSLLTISSIFSAHTWLKVQRLQKKV